MTDENHYDAEKDAARKVIGEWNKEQDRKTKHGISISEAIRLHNENATVRGMIVSVSQLFKMITGRIDVCENQSCSNKQTVLYSKPQFFAYSGENNRGCPLCKNKESFHVQYTYTNAVRIRLQDDQPYSDLEQLDVLLFDKDTENIRPGELIKITGHIDVEQNHRRGNFYPVLHAQQIKYEHKKEVEVTSRNIKAFRKFVGLPDVINRLVSMVGPNVIGHNDKKLGILRSAIGAPEMNLRGRIHTLLIGPPGLAKTMLARAATEIIPNSKFVTAQHASGKGITAIIDKDNDAAALRLGAVPQARGAICAVNEIGHMDFEDQAFLLDVMEEGQFTIDKYAIHLQIKSPTTIVATTNPIGSRWNDPHKITNSQMPILKALLDRFDQTFIFNEFLSLEENREYAEKKIEMNEKNIHYNNDFLKSYIAFGKTINPKITSEARSMLTDFWLELNDKQLGSTRTLDSLFRIAKAQARLHLSEAVDHDIATEVMDHYRVMMIHYGEIIKVVERPKEVAYKELVTILRKSRAPIALAEAAKIACEKNEQIRSFFGKKLDLKNNWKLQTVREMLLNNPSIEQVNDKPVVLQWFEDSSHTSDSSLGSNSNDESSNNSACDASEVCDDDDSSIIYSEIKGQNAKDNKSTPVETQSNEKYTSYSSHRSDTVANPENDTSISANTHDCHQKSNKVGYLQEHTLHDPDPSENHLKGEVASESRGSSLENTINRQVDVDVQQKLFDEPKKSNLLFSCYYCNRCQTVNKKDYERHIILKHQKKPAYPCKADLERLGVQSQNKSLEI